MSDPSFARRYGPWALVAGGSLGLGAAFSRELARRGLHVAVLAEAAHPPDALARELSAAHGVETRAVVADLGDAAAVERAVEALADLEIGLLVYDAAVSYVGPFLTQPLESKLACLDVNCRGPLLLVHHLAPAMVARGRGGILLMSSLAGLQGTALVATYAATKAFDAVLGEALWEELRGAGVDAVALCAGATRTPGYVDTAPRSGGALSAPVMEPEAVALEALAALGGGPRRIAGRANRVASALLTRLLPRRAAVALMGRSMRAIYPDRARD